MNEFQPSRQKSDLADVVEMLLDKGVVINADIAVSIGDTQLLGIQVRAAIASFDTAARYGLEFPEGTDMRRMAEAIGEPELAEMDRPRIPIDPTRGVNVTAEEREDESSGENATDGETDEGGSTRESENGSADGDDDLLGGDDRGTERLGARPDPDQPTQGGFDMLSDESEDEGGGDDGETSEGSEDERQEAAEAEER